MPNLDNLTPIYLKNKGKWVAIDPKRKSVVVSTSSAKAAYKKSKDLGVEHPILFKVPKKVRAYIG
uniref:DUF5678 domain-containing protein n=1 Tax=candidate division WWE3 bacterium TaxID=2053526 RepID=A0A7C4XHN4_UNCKA